MCGEEGDACWVIHFTC